MTNQLREALESFFNSGESAGCDGIVTVQERDFDKLKAAFQHYLDKPITPPKVIVVLEGGVLQECLSSVPDLQVTLVDHDEMSEEEANTIIDSLPDCSHEVY